MNKATKQTPNKENATALLERFQRERGELAERKAALADKRRDHAYDAAAGDAAATNALDDLRHQAIELETRIADIDIAIAEAQHRVAVAEAAEAKAAQIEHAQAIRSEWAAVVKSFADIDAGLAFATDAANRVYDGYARMQAHGLKPPPQLQLMLVDVVVGFLMQMPPPLWKQLNFVGLPHLPPNRRRNAASLADAWAPQTERQAAAIETSSNKPEAA
jgi:hypothetical protein